MESFLFNFCFECVFKCGVMVCSVGSKSTVISVPV